jgi:hypothetical protein
MSPSLPSDWRDRFGLSKHWFNIHGDPLWREGQRVRFRYGQIYGTVVVSEEGYFGVNVDDEINEPFEELYTEWRRVDARAEDC